MDKREELLDLADRAEVEAGKWDAAPPMRDHLLHCAKLLREKAKDTPSHG